ncbi:MAG: hypothetical protein H0W76_08300 [Pyrinomonadaceae bacterium]|nr:hypothetical protein [Pyrinomonadaceae bacterium]
MSNLKHSLLQLLITFLFVVAFAVLSTCAVAAQTGVSGWRFPAQGWVNEFESFDTDGEPYQFYDLGDGYLARFTDFDFALRPSAARVELPASKSSKLVVARRVIARLFLLDEPLEFDSLPYTKSTTNKRLIYHFTVSDREYAVPSGGYETFKVFAAVDVEDDRRHANVVLTSNHKELGVAPMDVPCPPER